MESASRHGISTIVALVGAVITGLIPFIGELADAGQPLGISPDLWVKVSAGLAFALVLSKAAQAVVAIATGGSAVVIEAPEPDLDVPVEGDPA
jgi:CRISPR/Cas system-associated exonuclease Cas4 (RecB family)